MEQMTEYERKRLENVQRNRQMLAALRVHDTAERLRSATKKPKSETKAYKPPKREREPEPSVLRRSLRTRGLSPHRIGDLGSDGLPATPREGLTPPSSCSAKPPTSSRKGPLRLAEAYAPYGEEDSYDHYFNRLRELRDHEPSADLICAKQDRESEGRGLVGPKFSPEDLNLEAKDIARVAPNRVLSVHILPCRERVIVVSGDREGYLSLWDADCEEEGKGFHMYQPHSAQLSGIATAPFSVEKAQDLLHRYLDKTLTIIVSPESSSHVCNSTIDDPEDEIRLFRRAPRGITVKPVETLERLIPRKKPRIPPRKEIDEKSPEFQSQIQSVAVDGAIIIEKAEKEKARALVRLQEKEAAAQAAAKREEERVALLKQQRGEEWLPSIASEMLSDIIAKKKELQDGCSNLEKKHSNRVYLNGIVHTNGTHQENAKTHTDKKLSEAR